jgi:hypothetical protein
MPRDALWVLPSGVTTVVTLDDDGNLIEDVAEAVDKPAEPPPPPAPVPAKAPDPPPQQHRHRGRRNRR